MDPSQNPAGDNPAPTTTDSDDAEWDQVGLDFLAGKDIDTDKKEEEQRTIDEQAKSKEGGQEEGAPEANPNDKKSDEEQRASDGSQASDGAEGEEGKSADDKKPADPKANEQQPPARDPDAEDRARRRAQLDLEADRKELARDIREKMFSDVPEKLLDSEGREIRTPQDVTQYRNPATGKNFTIEEATSWLMQADSHHKDKLAKTQTEVDRIVDVNLTIKEEADEVVEKYGKLLAKNPGLRKQVWTDWRNTLEVSEDGEVIVRAPVSLKNYFDSVLSPHLAYATEQERKAAADAEAAKKAENAENKKKVEQEKQQSRSDREDISSARTKDQEGMDSEEKEWAESAKAYYEG